MLKNQKFLKLLKVLVYKSSTIVLIFIKAPYSADFRIFHFFDGAATFDEFFTQPFFCSFLTTFLRIASANVRRAPAWCKSASFRITGGHRISKWRAKNFSEGLKLFFSDGKKFHFLGSTIFQHPMNSLADGAIKRALGPFRGRDLRETF